MPKKCPRCRLELPVESFLDVQGVERKQCDTCRTAGRLRFKLHYQANTAKVVDRIVKARKADPTKHRADRAQQARNWRKKYPAKKAASNKDYRARNSGRVAALNLKRKKAIVRATPAWADMKAISEIYERAARLRAEGHEVHVHHHVPLRGKNVCGLHVANNLRIVSKPFNLIMGNKHK